MNNLILKLNDVFSDIVFFEKNHQYKIGDEKAKFSVSQIIKKYEPLFDSQKIAGIVAKRDGLNISDVLDQWDFARDYSSIKGTQFHNYAENFFFRKRISIDDSGIKDFYIKRPKFKENDSIEIYYKELAYLIKNFQNFYQWWEKDHVILKTEFVIGDRDSKVCGTIDNLSWNKNTNEIVIFDYKTNKQIRKTHIKKQKMLGILSHLDDCEFTKYSLQLSIYALILENALSVSIPKFYIVWINGGDNYELIPCMDLKNEAKELLIESLNI